MVASLLRQYLQLYHSAVLSIPDFARLLGVHGSLEGIAGDARHGAVVEQALAQSGAQNAAVSADLKWLEKPEHHLLVYEDSRYPALLREIDCAPPVLYVLGDPQLLHLPAIALVGARNCTAYGERHGRWLAAELAGRGLAIVSGLARGIDAAAHAGALQAEGRTIAVLGTGIDLIYPRRHEKLATQIRQRGALLSEFPLCAPARPWHFPRRNRIITGLALGTLVIEAGLRSGSLVSARLAMEQNRDVFALPGPVSQAQSAGCHALIKQGAMLVEGPDDICESLPASVRESLAIASCPGQSEQTEAEENAGDPAALSVDCQTVLQAMAGQACLYESLLGSTSLNAAQLNSALLTLEMAGRISNRGGRYHPR